MPENGKTFTIKMWRPTKKETDNLWKLYHAAVRLQDRWHSNTVPVIAEELSATDLTRHEKMFLLRAWQMLVDDHARLDRFLGAFDTYLLNFQDPDAEHVAYKPELRQLLEKGDLFDVVLEAYGEALDRIESLEEGGSGVNETIRTLFAENDALRRFVRYFRQAAAAASPTFDYTNLQKEGERLCLFRRETYNPLIHGFISDYEPGETVVYVMNPAASGDGCLNALLAEAEEKGRREAIPDGYTLVPKNIYLDASDIESICSMCGDGNENGYGAYMEGRLWVGDIQDDDGSVSHGLHISTDDYSEEGGVTLCEFPAHPLPEVTE
ncbi:hypothetical protein [Escherichia coli]|uniref:hypothetical protein n=1 Tax=Escherichia coli TaxID=562 RepID=UPI000A19ED86|nr:hypothetical protein [Escherichia coli]